ncbi:MAG: HAD-IIB family hydrolase [Elainellaceae cyanobacterium]
MLLIFTDLDGTLLNPDDYRYDDALPVIQQLQAKNIPIIPVTSKTRKEVEALCTAIPLNEPFITENGSGIFIPAEDTRFPLTHTQASESYRVLQIGCTYAEARQGLKALSLLIDIQLQGFGDLSIQDIGDRTGLAPEDALLAKTRDFTEPFVTPQSIAAEELRTAAESLGFKLTVGDRFSHLIGKNAGKGIAVNHLIAAYQTIHGQTQVTTVGLGNSPNDLEMLYAVDIPIVIPGKKQPHPALADQGWRIADFSGAKGWAQMLTQIGLEENPNVRS